MMFSSALLLRNRIENRKLRVPGFQAGSTTNIAKGWRM
jgi:hypothetical protein